MEKNKCIILILNVMILLLSVYFIVYYNNDAKNYIYSHYERIRTGDGRNNNSRVIIYRQNHTTRTSTRKAVVNNIRDNNMKGVLSCQRIRQERFQKMCNKINLPLKSLEDQAKHISGSRIGGILVDKVHKVLAKTIAKAGCSSWKYILIKNSPKGHVIDKGKRKPRVHGAKTLARYGLKKLRKYSAEEIIKQFLNYFSFITVRHPLVRLESAYTSKLFRKNRMFHKRYGRQILKLYRDKEKEPDKSIFETGNGVRFEEFLRFIIETKKGRRNGHWTPYTDEQSCGMKVNYIAKLETASQDMNYIIKTRLSNKTLPVHLNKKKATVEHMLDKKYMHLPLFSNLSNHKYYIDKLMKFYGNDMLVYGYAYEFDEKTKTVLAKCEYYDSNGYCC